MMDGEMFTNDFRKVTRAQKYREKQEEYKMRQILTLISTLITEYVYMDIYDICSKNVEQLNTDVLQIVKEIFTYYIFYKKKL
jgi:hypothetical protein